MYIVYGPSPPPRRMTVGKACLWCPATTRTRTNRAPQADAPSRYALRPCRRLYGGGEGGRWHSLCPANLANIPPFLPPPFSFMFPSTLRTTTILPPVVTTYTVAPTPYVYMGVGIIREGVPVAPSATHVVSHATTRRTSAVSLSRSHTEGSKEGSKIPTTPLMPFFSLHIRFHLFLMTQ